MESNHHLHLQQNNDQTSARHLIKKHLTFDQNAIKHLSNTHLTFDQKTFHLYQETLNI